jgi:serine/threonine protein kinase
MFMQPQNTRERYTDPEINEVARLLRHAFPDLPHRTKNPRTYVVLRTIGHLDLMDKLIADGFRDAWFPVTRSGLPSCLPSDVKASVVDVQDLIITKAIYLEKGQEGEHCHFGQEESPPFEVKGLIGKGGYGEVHRVVSLISFKEYARKRVPRAIVFRRRQTEDMNRFVDEIELLKKVKHPHIVDFVGSYTDPTCINLLMSPVAEMDLTAYLKQADTTKFSELRIFFGCLATALEYLHTRRIRHKDIKPNNLLVNHGKILITDFGLSMDFTDADSSTTASMCASTPKYCAPEVALHAPRNTSSDIWSMGAVFMEMIFILKGKTATELEEFYNEHGSWQAFISDESALPRFVQDLQGIGRSIDNTALEYTEKMLSKKPKARPIASELVTWFADPSDEKTSGAFCGICCLHPHNEDNDI